MSDNARVSGERRVSPGGAIPASPGVYLLFLSVDRDCTVTVRGGRAFGLPAGVYAYVGSARGPGGLAARLARHLRQDKRRHWHLDYALEHAAPRGWLCFGAALAECQLAKLVAAIPGAIPVAGFGSSDCRCPAHLYALPSHISLEGLADILGRLATLASVPLPLLAATSAADLGGADD